MKLIFLDIDGVLNNPGTYKNISTDIALIERSLVDRLNKIVEATGANIVISSTWKYKFKRVSSARNFLCLACGVKAKIIGFTPNLKNSSTADEIKLFLKTYTKKVENFIILDDQSRMEGLEDHFVSVNGAWGLSDDNVYEAIKKLNGTTQ